MTFKILIFFFAISFFLVVSLSSSEISINSGGGGSIAFTGGNSYIEGFFFGEIIPPPSPSGGGGVSFPASAKLGGICNFSRDFISEHERGDKLIFTEGELKDLRIDIESELFIIDLTPERLLEILVEECIPVRKKPPFFLLLIALLVLGCLVFIYQNRKKTFMVILAKKLKNIRELKFKWQWQ